ncbi:MAG TPA: hypothetical protein VK007_08555 [Acidimicrobiales bacterium]|nr:hypothetical protein [Acidimicrobiales bacterium]
MTLRDLHADFSWVVVLTNALVGGWALAAHYLEQVPRRGLWPATVVAEITIAVQVALGVALISLDGREVAQMHAFYGFVALASVGIIYSYRQQIAEHLLLLYGLGGLFLMGLAIRAMTLSPFPTP